MPTYYFDLTDGGPAVTDHEGSDLVDIEEARRDALAVLGQRASDGLKHGINHSIGIVVRDEWRRPLLKASLALMVEEFAT